MKVAVLCIDGLEYRLVRRWHLREFMQRFYGTHEIKPALKPGDPLYTPLIWASFLLGKPAYLFGFDMEKISRERKKSQYGKLYPLYELRRKLFPGKNFHLRNFLTRLRLFDPNKLVKNYSKIESIPTDALRYTLVFEAEKGGHKVFCRDFPTLNEVKHAEMRALFCNFFELSLNEKLSKIEEVFEYSSKLLSDTIAALKSHDLVLFYTSIIDYAHHMFYRPRNLRYMSVLYSVYKRLANLIMRSIPNLSKLCILIVSDHGFDPIKQIHSDYGFWSMNIEPPRMPKTILDFKDIILKILDL
ncbi:MAG: alkaline phosphatase family protein [Candidatus Njordarchaeales archaeon]